MYFLFICELSSSHLLYLHLRLRICSKLVSQRYVNCKRINCVRLDCTFDSWNWYLIISIHPLTLVGRSRRAAAYSRQTFPWTICRSVRTLYVRRSACPVHCGKTAGRTRMPFGIIGRTGPEIRQVVGFGYRCTGRGTLGANLGRHCNQWGLYSVCVLWSDAMRPCFQITLGRLVISSDWWRRRITIIKKKMHFCHSRHFHLTTQWIWSLQ